MFANRFTAVIDACVLVSALKRNMILSLAEAEFFRLRWSRTILDETERGIAKLQTNRTENPLQQAQNARMKMEAAFREACVDDFSALIPAAAGLPDENDRHVVAAALKTSASVIVTDNLKDFPPNILGPLNLEAKSADDFIADTVTLDASRAVAALRQMRERFKRPEKTAEILLLDMEAAGLTQAVDVLRDHVLSL